MLPRDYEDKQFLNSPTGIQTLLKEFIALVELANM